MDPFADWLVDGFALSCALVVAHGLVTGRLRDMIRGFLENEKE